MRLQRVSSVDRGFVPRPPVALYRTLIDLRSYGAWWPGATAAVTDGVVALKLPAVGAVTATTEGLREGTGLHVRLAGPSLAGTLEWYLEPFREGTIVHAIVDAEPRRRWTARRLRRLRSAIRSALVSLRSGR